MRFDANTRYQDVSSMRIASYTQHGTHGDTVMLGYNDNEERYFVASFTDPKHGVCTNASAYPQRDKAWSLFIEIVQDLISGKTPKGANQFPAQAS